MDILAFCEDNPDWIQFTNAHVQLKKRPNAYLTFLENAPLEFLGRGDVLVIIGHGSPTSIGKYDDAATVANLLVTRKLRNNGATIILQTCSSADDSETANPILYQLKDELRLRGRDTIKIVGAVAPSITGWSHTTERVVPHVSLPLAGAAQGVSSFQNKEQIDAAEEYIAAHLGPTPTSGSLIAIAKHVHMLSANFFMDFAARVEPFTIGDTGFRTV